MKVYCLVRFPCRPIAYPSGTLTLSLLLDRGVGQILSFFVSIEYKCIKGNPMLRVLRHGNGSGRGQASRGLRAPLSGA